ncbi:hypothetical protein CHARACLAT_033303 [Characodon lateralis]|uniref:Uncharacterized protein n=1 Tax=Characodon lateralis TaxID=208331 RepID=A0ABU7FA49_9TELE|nr:hypothetical protein [Characodon lateralis]
MDTKPRFAAPLEQRYRREREDAHPRLGSGSQDAIVESARHLLNLLTERPRGGGRGDLPTRTPVVGYLKMNHLK